MGRLGVASVGWMTLHPSTAAEPRRVENAAQFSTLRLPLSGAVFVGWMTLHPSTEATSGFAESGQTLAHRRFDAGRIQAALGEHFAGFGVFDVVVRQA